MKPATPLNTNSHLMPFLPKGKSGTPLLQEYIEQMMVVQSMRMKMICSAWNLILGSFARSFAAVFIYTIVSPHANFQDKWRGSFYSKTKEYQGCNEEDGDIR